MVCPYVCTPLHGWVQFTIHRGVRLVRHMFSPKISPFPSWSSPPHNTLPRAKPTHHPKRHLDWFSRFCMGPKCYAVQCIVNGEENPQNCLFSLGFRHPATSIKIGKDWGVVPKISGRIYFHLLSNSSKYANAIYFMIQSQSCILTAN